MTCERHGGDNGSIVCRECDLESIEAHDKLFGIKRYPHLIYCNADHSKPLGGSMCICLRALGSLDPRL